MIPRDVVEAYRRSITSDGKPDYFRLHRYRFRTLLAALAHQPAHDVLEIGATPGQFTAILVEAGYRVRAVDLFPEQREALWRKLGVEVQFCNLDEQPLPYPDASFDAVVFSEVIEHLTSSPLHALKEMARVLRPNGRIIITTPNQHYFKSRMRTLADIALGRPFEPFTEFQRTMRLEGPQRYYTHNRLYTMQEVSWLCEQAGFTLTHSRFVDAWERVGVEPGRLLRHPLRVAVKAGLVFLGLCMPSARSMLLVVGRKGWKS
jgi:SAM-dependent methyltransferase